MEAVKVAVDCPAATCVEFPGRVRNVDNAVEMMGGAAAVTHGISQAHPMLSCRPRAQDAYSHPLFSSTSSRHRLLLRIMRPDPETDAPATVTTVARLATTHRFRGLADFQVVSGTAQPLDRSGASVPAANQAHSAEPSRLEAPMLVLPPLFAQSDSTFSYGYQGFARKDASSNIAWTPKAKQPLITWDAATPPALPPDSAEMMRQEHPVLLDTLLRLFAQRPAWLLPALLEHSDIKATDTKPAAVETAIALLSYRFLGGPWRPALICRGCDPRKETRFWRYQVLSCTLPDHWKGSAAHQKLDALAGCRQSPWRASADIDDAPPAHTIASQYGELVKLDSIPVTKVSYYQVCDVKDKELQDVLCERTKAATEGEAATPAEAPAAERGPTGATPAQADSGMQREASDGNGDEPRLNETAHEQSGWISPKVWQKCVNKLSARILSLLPDGMAPGDAGTGAFARQIASPAVIHTGALEESAGTAAAAAPASVRLAGIHGDTSKRPRRASLKKDTPRGATKPARAAGSVAQADDGGSAGAGPSGASNAHESEAEWGNVFANITEQVGKSRPDGAQGSDKGGVRDS